MRTIPISTVTSCIQNPTFTTPVLMEEMQALHRADGLASKLKGLDYLTVSAHLETDLICNPSERFQSLIVALDEAQDNKDVHLLNIVVAYRQEGRNLPDEVEALISQHLIQSFQLGQDTSKSGSLIGPVRQASMVPYFSETTSLADRKKVDRPNGWLILLGTLAAGVFSSNFLAGGVCLYFLSYVARALFQEFQR